MGTLLFKLYIMIMCIYFGVKSFLLGFISAVKGESCKYPRSIMATINWKIIKYSNLTKQMLSTDNIGQYIEGGFTVVRDPENFNIIFPTKNQLIMFTINQNNKQDMLTVIIAYQQIYSYMINQYKYPIDLFNKISLFKILKKEIKLYDKIKNN